MIYGGGGSGSIGVGVPSDSMVQTGQTDGTAIAHLKGINEAANSTAPVPTQPVATDNNGAVAYRVLVANNTTGVVVLAAATTVYSITGYSKAAAALYVKIYDKASAPTGSDTPVAVIGIAAASPVQASFGAVGLPLLNGFSYRITTGLADADTTAPTAGDASVTFVYTP